MLTYILMKRIHGVVKTLMIALILGCIAIPLYAAEEEARVVMLYGLDPYLPPFLATDKAIRESLAGDAGGRIQFFSESLDSQRIALERLEPELVALLSKKYDRMRVNVVVAVSRTALDFFERHGNDIWPGARVVYMGILSNDSKSTPLPPDTTAVLSYLDVDGTIDIARRLQPDARRIVVISGVSDIDSTTELQARKTLADLDLQIPAAFLSGLPLPELVARVANEPADSIVLYLTQFRDRDGRPYDPINVLRAVVEASTAPVYGTAETFIGLGVVAGSVASYESRGRLIGELVRRLLVNGPSDPNHTVLAAPNRCVADARVLQRWSLGKRLLPSDCEIRFVDISFWRHYAWQIALTLAVVVGQSILIVALIYQRRRRRQAEQAELSKRSELARAARFAIAGELTAAIAHEINQPLGAILSNAEAGELMLNSGKDERDELRSILADIRRDDLRASEVIRRLRELLSKNTFERQDFDLNEVVSDLGRIMRAEARRRDISLEFRSAPVALVIAADRVQIQQVLVNLVLNAMDAVAELPDARRKVVVTVAHGELGALLAVRDWGQGIAPEQRAKLFESFFTTKPNGMGLGLSITRTIVEAHGGRIRVESTPGEGSVFEAEFPLVKSSGAPHPRDSTPI